MIFRQSPIWLISTVVMVLTILIGDLLLAISGPDGYHQIFSFLVLFYLVPYLWIATKERQQPPFAFVICLFLFLRLYFIVYLNVSSDFNLTGGGDAFTYHIPRAKLLDGNYWSYLIKVGGDNYNGRLTHVLLATYMNILSFFGVSLQYGNVHNIAYIANTLLCVVTLTLYYKTVVRHSCSSLYGRRAVWFLAMNPYFFGFTGLPQKEALLFFGLALFAYSLVVKEKKYIFLMLSFFIIAFERIYMIPLLVIIFLFFDWKLGIRSLFQKQNKKLFLLLFSVLFTHWFIGFETAFEMAKTNQQNVKDLDGSALPWTGFMSNIIRAYFAPYALRHFSTEYITLSLFSLSNYALFVFYPYIVIKATLSPTKFGLAIFSPLMLVLVLIPYHSTFKLLMVVFFGGLFLDKAFPIKNRHNLSKR